MASTTTKSKKRKAEELAQPLPEDLYQIFAESQHYTSLVRFENRLDAILARKRLEVEDALQGVTSLARTLTAVVTHSVSESKMASGQTSKYLCLKVYGAILEIQVEFFDAAQVIGL
jgi:hypothetical protein